MKRKSNQKPLPPLAKAVDRALKRAARRVRETARRYGTPIYIMRNGRVIALKP